MLAALESVPPISLLQHPIAVLDSYVWGCARGIQLSSVFMCLSTKR